MTAFAGLVAALHGLAGCARQAAEFKVRTDAYRAEQVAAERALERVQTQSKRLTAGLPKHRKTVRTVRTAVEQAADCLDAIKRGCSADDVVRRANAVQRAAGRLTELQPELGRQRTQGVDEVVVTERAWPALPDIFHALGTGQSSEPVEHQGVDQPAAVASLSAADQDTSVAK